MDLVVVNLRKISYHAMLSVTIYIAKTYLTGCHMLAYEEPSYAILKMFVICSIVL